MQQIMGGSKTGNLQEAVREIKDPAFLIMIVSDKNVFEEKVKQLEQLYPGVPSMSCVGQGYVNEAVYEQGVIVTAFKNQIKGIANVLTNVSTMPVKCVKRIEDDLRKIGGNSNNTVCIDFCSSNDETVLATINSALRKNKISLTGGTAWEGLVACNGQVYEDACVYGLVCNMGGKIKVYKENLYITTDVRHIVTKADPSKNLLMELDGRPAVEVYVKETNADKSNIAQQTFINPFGRCIGDDVFIVSLKEMVDNQYFSCFRKVNQMDVLNVLQLGDYEQIVSDTLREIKSDFPRISGIFSINCLFRYLLFGQHNFRNQYFKECAQLGAHAGLIGLGEHCNAQHTNQTMSCVVFE